MFSVHISSENVTCASDLPCRCMNNLNEICTLKCIDPTTNCAKAKTITCRAGFPCYIMCYAEESCIDSTIKCGKGAPCYIYCHGANSCGNAAEIDASQATDVTIECHAEKACGGSSTHIFCGSGDCIVSCANNVEDACVDTHIVADISHTKSFECIGHCASSEIPDNYSPKPTFSPTYSPTFTPTYSPTISPTLSPLYLPTYLPTESFTNHPTYFPTESVTNHPTYLPSLAPTNTSSIAKSSTTSHETYTTRIAVNKSSTTSSSTYTQSPIITNKTQIEATTSSDETTAVEVSEAQTYIIIVIAAGSGSLLLCLCACFVDFISKKRDKQKLCEKHVDNDKKCMIPEIDLPQNMKMKFGESSITTLASPTPHIMSKHIRSIDINQAVIVEDESLSSLDSDPVTIFSEGIKITEHLHDNIAGEVLMVHYDDEVIGDEEECTINDAPHGKQDKVAHNTADLQIINKIQTDYVL